MFNYFLKQAEKMEGEKNFKIKTDGMETRLPLATNWFAKLNKALK